MHKIFKTIKSSIITGVILLVPFVASIFILYKSFIWLDNILPTFFQTELPRGTGVVGILLVTLLVGMVARNYIGKYIIKMIIATIASVPVLNKIYLTLQQVMDILVKPGQHLFGKVVLVQYPRIGVYALGFVTTRETQEISEATGKTLVCVYIPTAPNPTSGIVIYVPGSETIEVKIKPELAIKAIVSAGLVSSSKTDKGKTNHTLPEIIAQLKKWNKERGLKNIFDPRD